MPLRILPALSIAVLSVALARSGLAAQGIRVNTPLPPGPFSESPWDDVLELRWGPDSSRLLYTVTDRLTDLRHPSLEVHSADLARLDAGEPIPVVHLGTGAGIEVSPAGGWAAFAMRDPSCELEPCSISLRAAPLDGSAPARTLRQVVGVMRGYRFTPDGAHLVHLSEYFVPGTFFSSFSLASVPGDGGGPAVFLSLPQAGSDPGPFIGSFANAVDGRVVFIEFVDGLLHVYSVPVAGGSPVPLEPFELGPGADVRELRVTPDGRTALFTVYVPDDVTYELFAAPSDGSAPAARLGPPAPGSFLATGLEIDALGERAVFVRNRELWSVPITPRRGMVAARLDDKPVPGGGIAIQENTEAQFALAPDASRVVYRAEQDALGRF